VVVSIGCELEPQRQLGEHAQVLRPERTGQGFCSCFDLFDNQQTLLCCARLGPAASGL
jgi:hypothetical protein